MSKCNLLLSQSCGRQPCLQAFPGSELWVVACHLTTLPKMKYAWFRCMHVSVHKRNLRLNYQHVGICSFFSGDELKSAVDNGLARIRRSPAESRSRHSRQIMPGNCSTQTALQASGIGHWSTTP